MSNIWVTAVTSGITAGVTSGVAVTIAYFRTKALHVAGDVIHRREHLETILAIQNQSLVAQSVEQGPVKAKVVGSSPAGGAIHAFTEKALSLTDPPQHVYERTYAPPKETP